MCSDVDGVAFKLVGPLLSYCRRCFFWFVSGRFDLAEERTIVGYLVRHGYAVVAPASMDRSSG